MNVDNDIMVVFEQIKDIPCQIIQNVIWYKDQFAGTMANKVIYGVIQGENISATYLLQDCKIDLSGVVLEYGNFIF